MDLTQPGLPLKKGWTGTITHDYKRHGTTILLAVLDAVTGALSNDCMPRHRHQKCLTFLRRMERSLPRDLTMYVVFDNHAANKHPTVTRWPTRHPRVHLHFTPTSAS